MEDIDIMYFPGRHTIGLVRYKESDRFQYKISPVAGMDESADCSYAKEFGAVFPQYCGNILFGDEE